jgi:hypothetical protein
MSDQEPEEIAVPIVWVGVDDLPVLAVNQMVIQHTARDEFILSFGALTPPVVLGDEEQRREQLKRMTFVSVKPVARLGFNRNRMQELIRILQENLANHDQTFELEGPE